MTCVAFQPEFGAITTTCSTAAPYFPEPLNSVFIAAVVISIAAPIVGFLVWYLRKRNE